MKRYKPVGWRGEPHRHYLAAKGIKTKHHKYNPYFQLKVGDKVSVGITGIPPGKITRKGEEGLYHVEDLDAKGGGVYTEEQLQKYNEIPKVKFDWDPDDSIRDKTVVEFDLEKAGKAAGRAREEFSKYGSEVQEGLKRRKQELQAAGSAVAGQAKRVKDASSEEFSKYGSEVQEGLERRKQELQAAGSAVAGQAKRVKDAAEQDREEMRKEAGLLQGQQSRDVVGERNRLAQETIQPTKEELKRQKKELKKQEKELEEERKIQEALGLQTADPIKTKGMRPSRAERAKETLKSIGSKVKGVATSAKEGIQRFNRRAQMSPEERIQARQKDLQKKRDELRSRTREAEREEREIESTISREAAPPSFEIRRDRIRGKSGQRTRSGGRIGAGAFRR